MRPTATKAPKLAADLERWQARLPVDARRPGLRYRAGLFLARHRVLVASGTAVTVALCTGLGLALWQAREARLEARQAEAVQAFVIGLFKGSDPELARGHDVSAKELLDRGAKRLDAELQDQPAVLARLHHEIGVIYVQLGGDLSARPHLERSLQLYQTLGLEGSADAVEAAFNLTEVLSEDRQYGPARQAARRTLTLADRHFGSHNRWRLPVRTQLAWMDFEEGHAQAAVDAMVQALAEADREDPRPTVEKLRARTTLANAQTGLGQYAEARDAFAQVLRDGVGVSGYEVTDRLTDRYNLARTHYYLREYAACTDELAASVPEMDRHVGPRHDRTIKARSLWAQCLAEEGQYEHALAIARENLAYAKAREASDDDVVSLQQLTLAKLLKVAVRPREGLPLLREGLASMDAKYHEPFWNREIARRLLGELLLEDGQVDEALKTFAVAAANSQRIDNYAGHTSYADLMQAQAMALRLRAGPGDANHAIGMLGQAFTIYDKALGSNNVSTLRCATQLDWVRALAAPGDSSADAAFASTAERFEATLPSAHVAHAELQWMRAELSARRGAKASARAQFADARAAWRAAMGTDFVAPFIALH